MTDIACALFVRDNEVLLVKRASDREWRPNCWDIVGGHVEVGETVEQALVREAEEEVGLSPTGFTLLRSHVEPGSDGATTSYHIYKVSRWNGGEPRLLGDEHTAMRWVEAAAAASMTDIALEEYRNIFKATAGE